MCGARWGCDLLAAGYAHCGGRKSLRGHGIGTKVVKRLVQRGRELGYAELFVKEIYTWNSASRRCFEKAGFLPFAPTEKGCSYRLVLK